MNTIYKLYDALLTIKEYCASNNTCRDCPLIDSADCCIFTTDAAPCDWKMVKPTIIK
nr:MAG TPA: hypothetical protein [Caudoviricetes sp.]